MDLPVISSAVPANMECKISNADWQALIALTRVSFTAVNETISATEPGPALRAYPWTKLNSDGTPEWRYIYANGAWLALHHEPPDTVKMYPGSELSIDTYDGGEAGAVSATTGPFWERYAVFDAKIPIGPGTLESGAVVAIGGELGAEKHTNTMEEIPAHAHSIGQSGGNNTQIVFNGGSGVAGSGSSYGSKLFNTDSAGGNASDETVAHNNMPPCRAIWFIRRTARLFRRGS